MLPVDLKPIRCRKLPYPTRETAEEGARHFSKTYNHRSGVYRCPECTYWHLTTQRPRR